MKDGYIDYGRSFEQRYLACVKQIRDKMVIVADTDVEEFPLDSCYLKGSRTNVEIVGKALLRKCEFSAFFHRHPTLQGFHHTCCAPIAHQSYSRHDQAAHPQ